MSFIKRSVSSGWIFASCAALLRTVFPHLSQRWIIIYPRFGSGSARIGRRMPPQVFALSPGFISTCREQRQNGQWLREVYPSGSTSFPQFLHIKPLSFLVNRFVSITYLPTQNFEKISATTSSDTALPSSSAIAPRALSISEDAAS